MEGWDNLLAKGLHAFAHWPTKSMSQQTCRYVLKETDFLIQTSVPFMRHQLGRL